MLSGIFVEGEDVFNGCFPQLLRRSLLRFMIVEAVIR